MSIRSIPRSLRPLSLLLVLAGCAKATAPTEPPVEAPMNAADPAPAAADSPLLAEWSGPYDGVPAFDAVRIEEFAPAIEVGMARMRAELDAITANPEPPTFDNTIVAMERAGDDLDRVLTYYYLWRANLSSPEFREISSQLAPELAAFWTSITQDAELFARIQTIYQSEDKAGLRPDQQRLLQLTYDQFARNGATLEGEARERYAEIQQRLAELHTAFSDNVLADEEGTVHFLGEDQLSGLPESFVAAAASAAEAAGRPGEYAIANTRSSMEPFLTYSDERELREQVWRAYYSRGDQGGETDNNAIIAEILQLRHERVQLLGYEDYASWRLENRMARTPERALELMEAVWEASTARVAEEVADMQAIAREEGEDLAIQPWDYRYYAEKVRQQRYDFDSDEVKQYLQLDQLREAMFFVAGELFGYRFVAVEPGTVPVFHPDVRVWEVRDADQELVGLWYLDPYARSGKRSGAWATTYRSYDSLDGGKAVLASNNSNFIPAPEGEAVLISWDDAETLFHEFGHALHYLSSTVDYPGLTGGVRDYTEFQSQLLERWLLTEEVTDRYLVHYETGEPIPQELLDKIRAASTFNQGFSTTEYLASALMDMRYHTVDPTGLDPDAFEAQTLAELGMPEQIVMRHRSPHFGHIFSGEGYSAGYYGYLWADVLTADAAEAFAEAPGGFYDEQVAAALVEHLFAAQNSVPPEEAYRAFRGRDARIDALMRDRGFPVPPVSEP